MKFGSVCSGIEAASVAWNPLGWEAAWLSEIEPFPSAVLAHHYPDVPNLGDMTTLPERILSGEVEAPDLFCGGTPCQAFSVAGLRQSLDDARGNLSLVFCEIANAIDAVRSAGGKPASIVFWENVPGVLSTKDNAFGCFLGGLAGEDEPLEPPGGKWANAGYVSGPKRAVAWRVLDAQYFGVAQRRRRVFVVASARDDFDPAAVLFEFDGVRRDTAPSREAGQKPAGTFTARTTSGGGFSTDFECDGGVITMAHGQSAKGSGGVGSSNQEIFSQRGAYLAPAKRWPADIASTLDTTFGTKQGLEDQHVNAGCPLFVPVISPCLETQVGGLRQPCTQAYVVTPPLTASMATPLGNGGKDSFIVPIAFHPTQDPISSTDGTTHGLGCGSSGGQASVAVAQAVEHEALYTQGFNHWSNHASTQEANTGEVLRTLRKAIGEEAFAKWGLGILDSLQSPQILRQALHGLSIRPAAFSRSWVVHCALSRPEDGSGWLLQSLRETGSEGCPPQGWEPPEQLARELGAYLSELSQPGAQAARFMRDLWWAAQGAGVLREALSAVQEMGRPTHDQGQPTHGGMQVRRLTPEEAEFLQGFPRHYTAIPWRKKPADQCPDGPRYKALGNSWAVPVVRWIGKRIAAHLEAA